MSEESAPSAHQACEVCARPLKAAFHGPHDRDTCSRGFPVDHPAGMATACYRRGYERLLVEAERTRTAAKDITILAGIDTAALRSSLAKAEARIVELEAALAQSRAQGPAILNAARCKCGLFVLDGVSANGVVLKGGTCSRDELHTAGHCGATP